jgi:hypothetical protein
MFIGEVLPRPVVAGGPGKALSGLAVGRPMAGNVCTDLAAWVQDVLASLFDALKIDASGGGFTGLLADIWNTAVDLAQGAVQGLIKQVTKPVVDAVTGVLAVLGTVAMAASLLKPWTVSVTAKPGTVKFGVNALGEEGAFAAKAVGPPDPWPADIRDCAQAAGITLPDPSDVSGSKVTWSVTGLPPFGEQLQRADAFAQDGTARLAFRAGTEASAKGPLLTDTAAATVTIARSDIEQFRNFLTNLLFGGFPGIIGQAVAAIVNALTQPVIDQLAAMVSPSGSGWVAITHHGPEQECEAPPAGIVPDGTWSGPIALDVAGQPASLSGVILSDGAGQAQMTVAAGKVTGGTWSLQSSASGTVGDGEGSGTLNAAGFTISDGAIGGSAAGPVLTGTGALQGSIIVTAAGMTFDVPINEVHPAGATMTIVEVTCDAVTATFIPSFNEQAGGLASFSGVATWTGRRS